MGLYTEPGKATCKQLSGETIKLFVNIKRITYGPSIFWPFDLIRFDSGQRDQIGQDLGLINLESYDGDCSISASFEANGVK